jgi:predicted esterase
MLATVLASTSLILGCVAQRNDPSDPPLPDAPDVADIPARDLRADGDERKRYALIGPREDDIKPDDGWRLLIILPGGPGTIDFHPFVKRIVKHAVPEGYLVAQPVRVKWSEAQSEQVVWPTRFDTLPEVEFTTEDFLRAVIEDVAQQHTIDRRHVFTLGWSSSGPPSYVFALERDSPVTGAFVAMSIFPREIANPEQGLPARANRIEGKSFYLLHSPADWIPISHARTARDTLSKHGASVTLTTYPGGHGWVHDPYGHIRRGIEWLERQVEAQPEP